MCKKWILILCSAVSSSFVSIFNDSILTTPRRSAARIGSICIPSWGLVIEGHGSEPYSVSSRRGLNGRVSIATRTESDGSEREIIVKMIGFENLHRSPFAGPPLKSTQHPQREKFALQAMAHSDVVPRMYAISQSMSRDCSASLLVQESVGMDTLMSVMHRRTDLELILKIGSAIMEILSEIHYRGFVYNNVAPHHFVIGDPRRVAEGLRVIDFSLAEPFLLSSGVHVPESAVVETDFLRPASEARSVSVFETRPSRRNDMHALAEMLILLWSRGKQWPLEKVPRNSLLRPKDVRFLKQHWRPRIDTPQLLVAFWEYTRNMAFFETPSYDVWMDRFGRSRSRIEGIDFSFVVRFFEMENSVKLPPKSASICPPPRISVRDHGDTAYVIHPGELSTNVRSAIRYTPKLEGVVVKIASDFISEKWVLSLYSDSGITPSSLDLTSFVESTCGARMMVMESVGALDLNDFRISRPTNSQVARLAVKTIELVRQFHERGFVHGDLHLGNLCYTAKDLVGSLKLIDFDRSVPFVDPFAKRHIREPPSISAQQRLRKMRLDPTLLSVYELGGCSALSRRDDWNRIAEMILNLVSSEYDVWKQFRGKILWEGALEAKMSREETDSIFFAFYRSTLEMEFSERPPYEEWTEKFLQYLDDCV